MHKFMYIFIYSGSDVYLIYAENRKSVHLYTQIIKKRLCTDPLYIQRDFLFSERTKNMASLSEQRRKSREQSFILLFEKSFNEEMTLDEIIRIAVETEVIEKDEYTEMLVKAAEANIDAIDAEIEKNLKGWTMGRISKVSLALLRMAIAEMKFSEDVPSGVSINEAVEICKIYGSDEDKSFINGVLGSVARSAEA